MDDIFEESSDVTLVITSCGRFDLLKETLESFIKYNTYPVKDIIITEDSGNESIRDFLPEKIKGKVQIFVNKPKLGQIKSIDYAYSKISTKYVFHCEDDWEFYRPAFIEDSIKLMESDEKILQVWLRSFSHDIAVHSPYHFLKRRQHIEGVYYYQVGSNKEDWQGFSFNPGVKRMDDYKAIGSYASFPSEKELSRHYASLGYYAVILENDAVLHTGFESHVVNSREQIKKCKRKQRDVFVKLSLLVIGFVSGFVLG